MVKGERTTQLTTVTLRGSIPFLCKVDLHVAISLGYVVTISDNIAFHSDYLKRMDLRDN